MMSMARSRTRYADLHKLFQGGPSPLLTLIGSLSILFEDLRIEVAGVLAPDNSLGDMDTLEKHYRKLYFVRRSLVTLSAIADAIKAIAADAGFRERKHFLRTGHLQEIHDANSYFSKNVGLINQYRNEFGAHLDQQATQRAIGSLQPGIRTKVSFADTTKSNSVLQVHFAEPLLEAAILTKLSPGHNLQDEFNAVLKVFADAVMHAQRATQALVYSFLWDRCV